VLDRGTLVESGSHDDLLAADTIYSRLHATQTGEPAELLTSN
jgi:ABC-type multidrug transport system fused ATPase/permease subunit